MKIFLDAKYNGGLTLMETVIGVGLFASIAMGLFATYVKITAVVRLSQEKIVAVALANEQLEIMRNLPYSKIGTVAGIPSGIISPVQTLTRGGMTFVATTTIRNVDLPFDGTAAGTPNDLSPADNKFIEIEITCTSCASYRPVIIATTVGPKDLESASTNGSLFVRVFDSGGQPIKDADVHIVNIASSPTLNITDVTATSGVLQLIDAPPGSNSYQVTASKAGYSTEMTRGAPTTTNPAIPHANVVAGTVTQLTLFIDLLATLNFSSVSPSCGVVPNVGVALTGEKLITEDATSPVIPKYNNWFSTGGAGSKTFTDIEWDNYTLTASSATHDLAGIVPLSPLVIAPGLTQNVQLVMVPKSGKSLLVTVKEAVSGLPITGADVTLTLQPSGTPVVRTTGRGFLKQTDWSGGSGQSEFIDPTEYKDDDINVETAAFPGEVRLRDVLGLYTSSGVLESSIFDTGAISNFYQFTFLPTAQPIDTGVAPVLFQLSTGVSTTSMGTYRGPDGTASTYYSATSTDISAVHNGDRYLQYKMYLTTASTTYTPSVSDVQFTFTSACIPPGQVIFQGLANGTYDLTVSKAGYTDYTGTVTVNAGTLWQEVQAPLAP